MKYIHAYKHGTTITPATPASPRSYGSQPKERHCHPVRSLALALACFRTTTTTVVVLRLSCGARTSSPLPVGGAPPCMHLVYAAFLQRPLVVPPILHTLRVSHSTILTPKNGGKSSEESLVARNAKGASDVNNTRE